MKISIITVSYNSASTIRDTIESVLSQDYPDIEHIIVDGASTDSTGEIVRSYGSRIACFLSEPDTGIYDAMNKGILRATGEVIAILNSDDVYAHSQVVSRAASTLTLDSVDCCYADLVYIDSRDPSMVVRYYDSAAFTVDKFSRGWMPAHPTVFIRSWAYQNYGLFRTDFRIAADYELMIRFLATHQLSFRHVPEVWVKMRTGGVSTAGVASTLVLNREIVRACRDNGISTNLAKVMSKYFAKLWQLRRRPPVRPSDLPVVR